MNNAECTIDETHLLDIIFSMLKKTRNSFLNSQLDVLRLNLLEALPPLISFISAHFDYWPYDQKALNFSIQLHPDYLRDTSYKKMKWEDRQRWDLLFEQLKELTVRFHESYSILRRSVKELLHV